MISGRAHDPRVQQTRHREVVHEHRFAPYFGRQVDSCDALADDVVSIRRLFGDALFDLHAERPAALHVPIADGSVRPRHADLAVDHAQRRHLDTEVHRGALEHDATRVCARLPQRAAAILHRHRSGRDEFVRRTARHGRFDADACRKHVEFLCSDRGERGQNALADLHLAGADHNRVARFDLHPPVEVGVALQRRGQLSHGRPAVRARAECAAARRSGTGDRPALHGSLRPMARQCDRTTLSQP